MDGSSSGNNLFMWVEFLLDRKKLKPYLTEECSDGDPGATNLLTQFIINADRSIHLSGETKASTNGGDKSEDSQEPMNSEQLAAACRSRKTRSLILMAMQVSAYLNWDLDSLCKIPIVLQHSLMNHVSNLVNAEVEEGNKAAERSKEFLRVLFHRWVLRTINNHNVVNRSSKINNVVAPCGENFNSQLNMEAIIKQLNEEESAQHLKNFFNNKSLFAKVKDFKVPNFDTFTGEKDPDWSSGTVMARTTFESLVHFELSVYWLYQANISEASHHFKSQKSKPEQYSPYLKISSTKVEGYKKALGLSAQNASKPEVYKTSALDYSNVSEMARLMREGRIDKLKRVISSSHEEAQSPLRKTEKLSIDRMENYEASLIASGDEKATLSILKMKLIETSDVTTIKECLAGLNRLGRNGGGNASLYTKLFSGWELPIPVHHAILNIQGGPFLDYVYVLVAKSRQLLTINMFLEARNMLVAASLELGAQLKHSINSGGMGQFFYNISKLMKMLEWEILLIDINHFFVDFDPTMENVPPDLIRRCQECLDYLSDQSNEVNPRSEIVENVLMALINMKEYNLVLHYDQTQSQRYPFLDFLSLLARVCLDLFVDRKDTSSNYRELWSAVLPLFSNYNTLTGTVMGVTVISGSKKMASSSIAASKPAILSNRNLLLWAIDRSCAQNLISVWASLLARLHNHILDDVGLQIVTEYLHIWPNILDDVTAAGIAGLPDNKVSRVAGSSKLNSRHIRDFLFHLLEKALVCTSGNEMISWLRCLGDVHLAASVPAAAMKCYIEYLAVGTDFFEKHNSTFWGDSNLFKRMIKCCELMGAHTQAVILCQFLTEVDYSMAFGKAQEKVTTDASDALYGFIWELTILEFLINLHSKRNETTKRQEAIKVMGLLELNSNNNEEIQREAMYLRKSQFMRTLAKQYVFL